MHARPKTLLLLTLLTAFTMSLNAQEARLEPLFQMLRNAIDSIPQYDAQKHRQIDSLKRQLPKARGNIRQTMALNSKLFKAYSKMRYDSALVYIDNNLKLARQLGNDTTTLEITLIKARYYATAGSFIEASHLIDNIREQDVPRHLLPLFYDANFVLYIESAINMRDQKLRDDYFSRAFDNRSKVIECLDTTSLKYYHLKEAILRGRNECREAMRYNDLQLRLTKPDTPDYSEVTFFRSCIYESLNDIQQQKYWLLKSAISDIRSSIKDQASLWTLANILSNEGDVKWSYLFMRTSQDGLSYYNSPLRYLQSVNILSMIDHNYQIMTNKQNNRLKEYLAIISLLALLLGGAVVYIVMQMKKLNSARMNLHSANTHLQELNSQLSLTVQSLYDSNNIKEEYIGRFLTLYAEYMKKSESFRSVVLKKAQSGQLEDYLSHERMRQMEAREVDELIQEFDKAFLNIVPTFVDDLNRLLRPECRITTSAPNTLNTELRIFALIRLGVTDSSKIAEFLHYSVQTIYNYRSAIKKCAIGSRDDFENQVKKISC